MKSLSLVAIILALAACQGAEVAEKLGGKWKENNLIDFSRHLAVRQMFDIEYESIKLIKLLIYDMNLI